MLKSKIFRHLFTGAVILTLLVGTVLLFQQYLQNQLYGVIAESKLRTEKMHLVSSLMEVARSRDRDLLQQQNAIIPHILTNQRKILEIAMTETSAEAMNQASKLLYTEVFPGQGQMIDLFMEMLNGVKDETVRSTEAAMLAHDRMNRIQFVILGLFFIAMVYVMTRTIRAVIQVERKLYIDKEQAQITLRSIGDVVLITDAKGQINTVNDAFGRTFGQDGQTMIGRHIGELFSQTDLGSGHSLADCVDIALTDHRQFDLSLDLACALNEKDYHLAISVSPILGAENRTFGTVITIKDVTEQRRIAEHIEYQASYDQLTGLLNRHSFERRCRDQLATLRSGEQHCIALIDLDRFKSINDTCGHSAGDEALKQIGNLIKSRVRKGDYAARIGGDEFTVFLNHCGQEAAAEVMEALRQMIADYRFMWEEKIFALGCSIGAVVLDEVDTDFSAAFRCADTACYISKDAGRNRATFLDLGSQMVDSVKEESDWVRRIQNALDQNGLVLHAQPIMPAQQVEPPCIIHEVLVRMREEGQIILPYQFIPAAERYDLIASIDLHVTRKVLALIKADHLEGIVCVNLSGKTLGDSIHTQAILAEIKQAQIPKGRLCFEVTETAMISNLDNASAFLQEIRTLGCLASLDDFGSGLSSFNYLDTLPLDYIKIDGALIQRVLERKETRVMVASIHNIAHTIGLRTIAEYVDSEQLYETLKHMGIDCFQGFYLGRPQPLPERSGSV